MLPAGSDEDGYQIDLEFVQGMMEQFRERKNIHRRYAFQIVLWVRPAPCCVAAPQPFGVARLQPLSTTVSAKPDAATELLKQISMLEAPHLYPS